jgi:hypothetical protein
VCRSTGMRYERIRYKWRLLETHLSVWHDTEVLDTLIERLSSTVALIERESSRAAYGFCTDTTVISTFPKTFTPVPFDISMGVPGALQARFPSAHASLMKAGKSTRETGPFVSDQSG